MIESMDICNGHSVILEKIWSVYIDRQDLFSRSSSLVVNIWLYNQLFRYSVHSCFKYRDDISQSGEECNGVYPQAPHLNLNYTLAISFSHS